MTVNGNRVRRYLAEVEKRPEWLAVQLDCSMKTVTNLLAGKMVSGETLINLARLIGCQVEDLVTQRSMKRPA